MRIAIAQIDACTGAFRYNLHIALDMAMEAADEGADLIVFPEYALCGAVNEGLLWSTPFLQAARRSVTEFASKCPLPAVIGSLCPGAEEGDQARSAAYDGSPASGGDILNVFFFGKLSYVLRAESLYIHAVTGYEVNDAVNERSGTHEIDALKIDTTLIPYELVAAYGAVLRHLIRLPFGRSLVFIYVLNLRNDLTGLIYEDRVADSKT